MSFWTDENNEQIQSEGRFQKGGIEPMPHGTVTLAAIEEAVWYFPQDEHVPVISIKWVVLKPSEFEGRKFFQKLRVEDDNHKKASKDKKMLAAIDFNAGGKLLASGRKPTDEDMVRHLSNKCMHVKVGWFKPDDGDPLNWVMAVESKESGTPAVGKSDAPNQSAAPSKRTQAGTNAQSDDYDDIPF